ncbi:MAG: DUF4402 domain-containing protein [Pacificimonas sp.]|jgi:hypothetical protein|nr:DUF4402 domain-containing protein [Pacificimonas sp.]
MPRTFTSRALSSAAALLLAALMAVQPARACQTCDVTPAGPSGLPGGLLAGEDDLDVTLDVGFTFSRTILADETVIENPYRARAAAGHAAPGIAGTVTVRGRPGALVDLDMPRQVRLGGPGGAPIWVRGVSFYGTGPFRLDADGLVTVALAGSLALGDHVAPGAYDSDFWVRADYVPEALPDPETKAEMDAETEADGADPTPAEPGSEPPAT